jgi:hypothetical protein
VAKLHERQLRMTQLKVYVWGTANFCVATSGISLGENGTAAKNVKPQIPRVQLNWSIPLNNHEK